MPFPSVPATSAPAPLARPSAAPSQPSSARTRLTFPPARPNPTPISHPGCCIGGKIAQQTQYWRVTTPAPAIQAAALLHILAGPYILYFLLSLPPVGLPHGFWLVNDFIPELSTQSPVISEHHVFALVMYLGKLHLDTAYLPLCNARGVLHKPPLLF